MMMMILIDNIGYGDDGHAHHDDNDHRDDNIDDDDDDDCGYFDTSTPCSERLCELKFF